MVTFLKGGEVVTACVFWFIKFKRNPHYFVSR